MHVDTYIGHTTLQIEDFAAASDSCPAITGNKIPSFQPICIDVCTPSWYFLEEVSYPPMFSDLIDAKSKSGMMLRAFIFIFDIRGRQGWKGDFHRIENCGHHGQADAPSSSVLHIRYPSSSHHSAILLTS